MTTTRTLLADHKMRCTPQRRAIYETLRTHGNHPTAEGLYRLVKPRIEHLSLATVYNTLDALCKAGLARRLPTSNGKCRYDADTSEHLHVCFREDGTVEDVPPDLGGRLAEQLPRSVVAEIERRLNIKIDGVSIQFQAHRRDPEAGPAGARLG